MHPLQMRAQAYWRRLPVEQRERPPLDSTRNSDIAMVDNKTMPVFLGLYGRPDERVPGSRTHIGSVIRNQLTGWLLGFRCETWIGLDAARVNTVCWFVTHCTAVELEEAVREAHLNKAIPAARKDDWARFLSKTPVRLRPEEALT